TLQEDIALSNKYLGQLRSGKKKSVRFQKRYVKKDGSIIFADASVSLQKDKDDKPPYYITTIMDITERKKAEEKIRESEEKYRSIVENSSDQIFMLDKDYKFLSINKTAADISRKSPREMIGMSIFEIFPENIAVQFSKNIKNVFDTGKSIHVEEKMLVQGREFYNSTSLNPVRDDKVRVIAVTGIVRDITERKKAEESLKESETHLSNALRIAKLGHWEYDVVKNQFTFTDEFYTMFRTSAEEMGGYTMSPERYTKLFVHPDDVSVVATETQKAIETTDPNFSRQLEHKMVYADGSIGYIAVRFRIIKDSEGHTIKTFGVNQDITEQKHLEEQLQIRQRMDSLGILAGGLAHDFNNMLTGIMGNLDILYLDSKDFTAEQKECLRDAKESSEQAASLVRQFQKLSRFEISVQKSIDIYEVTDEVFNLLKRTTNRLIDKEIGFKKGDFFVKGNKSELNQVLLNLGINSCESIEENGVKPGDFVKIDAQKYRAEGNDKTGLSEGDYVHIRFADSGTGMSKDVLKKMFDPFYTTKTKGIKRGQGLGLAMVYNIVTRFHNGVIYPESEEGKGTIMHIYLPMAEAEEEIKEEPATEIKGGNETILVVDDEVNILKSVKRILGNYGYNIITASDGEKAIDIYAANKDSIKAVILDLNMPRMSGEMVFEKLLGLNPEIKVIIFTGHSDEFAREGILAKAKEYILKPDFTESLPKTLRIVL
ncbi:PAS domain S-box protein, partial [candidate division KSB1 bacterium]